MGEVDNVDIGGLLHRNKQHFAALNNRQAKCKLILIGSMIFPHTVCLYKDLRYGQGKITLLQSDRSVVNFELHMESCVSSLK